MDIGEPVPLLSLATSFKWNCPALEVFLKQTSDSPDNQYSLRNALACGFEIVCRREMYGGYDRYLLAKTLK